MFYYYNNKLNFVHTINPEEIQLRIYCALIQAHPNDYPDKILNDTERFTKAYLERFQPKTDLADPSQGV